MHNFRRFSSCLLSLMIIVAATAQPIDSLFDLQWQTEIGLTTYRSNMLFDAKRSEILIGSNGDSRGELGDAKDGVYALDAKTGKIRRHIHQDGPIDGDVNGLAMAGKRLFFGDDQRTIYAYERGKRIWYHPISVADPVNEGDIETQPALADLTSDDIPDVIVPVEGYGLVALDGRDGTKLWEVSGERGHCHGLNAPALHDLNADGIMDVIWGLRSEEIYYASGDPWGTYGDWLVALDGRSGEQLWRHPLGSALHASPLVFEMGGQTLIIAVETYSTIHILTPKGEALMELVQNMPDGGISAFFSSPAFTEHLSLIMGTSWWGAEDGVWVMDIEDARNRGKHNWFIPDEALQFVQTGRVSATAVSGELLANLGQETVIGTEGGELLIFSADGDLLHRLQLPAGVEAAALIEDIDRDGQAELLIACLDGKLYCYQAKG